MLQNHRFRLCHQLLHLCSKWEGLGDTTRPEGFPLRSNESKHTNHSFSFRRHLLCVITQGKKSQRAAPNWQGASRHTVQLDGIIHLINIPSHSQIAAVTHCCVKTLAREARELVKPFNWTGLQYRGPMSSTEFYLTYHWIFSSYICWFQW